MHSSAGTSRSARGSASSAAWPIASRDFRELRLDRISRDFGQVHALRDVTLTVKRGEFVALLGPSGCGKSTALNCIAGLLHADRRRDLARRSAARRARAGGSRLRHGVPELRAVPAHDACGGTSASAWRRSVGRRPRSRGGWTRRWRWCGSATRRDKLPGQLSGGQQQRVAIARAIVVEPPLVLMDEPLSNLDAKLRLEMRAEIRRIHTMLGCSTIYVTHDQEEALSLADRIVVMIDGQMRQIGTPEELYAPPGAAPMSPSSWAIAIWSASRAEADGRGRGGDGRRRAADRHAVATRSAIAVVAAIRPDDLRPTADGPIAATVEIAEYHGRDFYAVARGARRRGALFPLRPAAERGRDGAPGRGADRGCWSMRVVGRMSSGAARTAARRRFGATARARSGRRDAAGAARRAVRAGAVHLSVPLRPGAVVPAEGGRLAGELHHVLLRSVPLRHDLHDAADRGAGHAAERACCRSRSRCACG